MAEYTPRREASGEQPCRTWISDLKSPFLLYFVVAALAN